MVNIWLPSHTTWREGRGIRKRWHISSRRFPQGICVERRALAAVEGEMENMVEGFRQPIVRCERRLVTLVW